MKIENKKAYIPCEIVENQINNGINILVRINKTHDLYINRMLLIPDIDQPKPVVPKFVAEWIEEAKEGECSLCTAFGLVDGDSRNFDWLFNGDKSNQDTFARAWLDGYEIEQEQLYTVEIPNPNSHNHSKIFLHKDNQTGKVFINKGNFNETTKINQLTEQEIRKDFDWAWEWAKEVRNDII